MKTILLSTTLIAALSATAFAAVQVDTNGDGFLTLDEVNAAFPDIKAEEFSAMDVNADGVLDTSEVAAAQDAGLMPDT